MNKPGPGPFDQAAGIGLAGELLPDPLPADPFPLLVRWHDEAHQRRVQPNPNAMTLATVEPGGRPTARVVLCKAIDPDAGYVEFFTNYRGGKGRALDAHPFAAIVFHWDDLDRQARIEGPVVRSPAERSDEYFASRPWESRIGAWASDQSEPIPSRSALLARVAAAMRRFGLDPDAPAAPANTPDIPRPPHWGGFRVFAERVELWVSGNGRIHDRAEWRRILTPAAADGFKPGPWASTRLQP